jgi:hypothetical protein
MRDETLCSEEVRNPDIWSPYKKYCSRKGTSKHEGRLYCKQHHPDAVKKRNDERDAKWEKGSAERNAKRKKEQIALKVLDNIEAILRSPDTNTYRDVKNLLLDATKEVERD